MDFYSAEVRESSKQLAAWCRNGNSNGRMGVSEREWQCRAMGVGEASKGEKAVADAFYSGLIAGMSQTNVLRRFAFRVITETGAALHLPIYDDSSVEAVMLPENAQAASADVEVDSIELGAHQLHSKIVKVSGELLTDGGPMVQKHIGTLLGRRIGRLAAELCTTGSGVGEPAGILVDANVAVTTVAATAFTYDDIADLRYSLDASYDEAGQWLMSPATLKAVRKIVDDASRPIFDGELLLGRGVVLSEAMPAIAAESKPILFGDLRSYYLREVGDTAIRRYFETYVESGQIGLAATHRIDGKLADINGVAVLQMADA